MEDFLSSPIGIALISGILLLIFIFWSIKQHRNTQNEIARYEELTNDGLLKPAQSEVEYDYVAGEFGSNMQIFKSGMIIFDDGRFFSTNSEGAFEHIEKCCIARYSNFIIGYQKKETT
jgi:hypothetical protein